MVAKKRKAYTAFSDETRADNGRYAAENGNAAALKKFRSDIPDLTELSFAKALLKDARSLKYSHQSCLRT